MSPHFNLVFQLYYFFPLEPWSNLSQQQECQSLAQRLSVSVPISQKQLHTQLTQRMQQVLSESENQGPVPQEPVALERKKIDIREDSKDRSLDCQADRCAPTLSAPKKQQAKRNGLAKGKSKQQMSPEVEATLIKAPAKASPTKVLRERIPPNVKAETKRDLSSKEKV